MPNTTVQLNLTTYRKRQPFSASSKWQRPLYVRTAARAASTVQLRAERLQLVAVPVWRSGATTLQQLLGACRQSVPHLLECLAGKSRVRFVSNTTCTRCECHLGMR